MRIKLIVLFVTLVLALSAGTSPALAKKSDEAAALGLATAGTQVADTAASSSVSSDFVLSTWDIIVVGN